MNPRILVIAAVVLVVLLVGAVGVYFSVFKKSAPVEDPAIAAARLDTDGDGVPDVIEVAQGTDPNDKSRYPAHEGRAASHKKVLVSRQDIAENQAIRDDMVEVKEVPMRGGAPEDALLEGDRSRVVGKITRIEIKTNDFFNLNMIYGGRPQLSYLVPKYKRAVTLRYDPQAAVAGLVELGDLVDVIGHFRVNRRFGGAYDYSKIILQNARIIAKGDVFLPRDPADTSIPPPATSLTVSVYPHEAERLVWAEGYAGARLVLALRSPVNDVLARTYGTTDEGLFGRTLLNEARTVELYAGTRNQTRAEFDPDDLERRGLPASAGRP